jgi:hypothetical protein
MTMLAHILFLMFRVSFAIFTLYGFMSGLKFSYEYEYYRPLMAALGLM